MTAPWILAVLEEDCSRPFLEQAERQILLEEIESAEVVKLLKVMATRVAAGGARACAVALLLPRLISAPPATLAMALEHAGSLLPGGLMRADPRLKALMTSLLNKHRVSDMEWWTRFYGGMSAAGLGAVHVRKALYEAVLDVHSSEEQLGVFQSLIGFEDASTVNASFACTAMGLTLRGRFGAQDLVPSLGNHADFRWRRVLLWSLETSEFWPYRAKKLNSETREALVNILRATPRDHAEESLRVDLINFSWQILGAEAAAEEFAQSPVVDDRELVQRITVVAYEIGRFGHLTTPGTQEAFARAEAALATHLSQRGHNLDGLMEEVLKHSKTLDQKVRDVLVRALGPRITELRKDLYDKLVR